MSRAKVLSASLTAREFGKISKTSGSINTTFVPSAYRAAVTPRAALEKSYSARMVSSSMRWAAGLLLLFFIAFSFGARRLTRTDDSRVFVDFSVANDQKAIAVNTSIRDSDRLKKTPYKRKLERLRDRSHVRRACGERPRLSAGSSSCVLDRLCAERQN